MTDVLIIPQLIKLPGARSMSSAEPPAPPLPEEECSAPQDDQPEEADLDKLKETEAAVMSLLASEADGDSPSDVGQTLVSVTEPYTDEGDCDELPVKETSSGESPQDNEAGLPEAAAGEVTVKRTTEGLSSLVSYSSSSTEASASEDNSQEVPENSNSDDLTREGSNSDSVKATDAVPQISEDNHQEKPQVSPGEVLAAAADALASAVDDVQVEAEEVAAVDSVTAALAQAEASLSLKTAEDDVDAAESSISEPVGSEHEEEAASVQSSGKEENSATATLAVKEGDGSTEDKHSPQESKGKSIHLYSDKAPLILKKFTSNNSLVWFLLLIKVYKIFQ